MLEEGINKLKQNNLDPSLAFYLDKYLDNKEDFEEGINRLINNEPIQYIVGNVNFYGLKLNVNKNVLIPRFETELLVNKTINYLKQYFNPNIKILDIGTGSGCIAITLKKYLKNINIDAIDISKKALKVAKENALENNTNINFYESNLFSNVNKKYDCIISNPPYIKKDEQIMEIVKKNEPHLALYAENEGLEFYEKILKEANLYLNKKNMIAFEIGCTQANDIKKIAKKYFYNSKIIVEKDYQKRDRFIFIFNF